MLDRMFKKDDRDFWLYPKLLLVGVLGVVLAAFLKQWMSLSEAALIGLIPLLAAVTYGDRPLSYRRWLLCIGSMVLLMAGFETFILIVKRLF
jgi:hypothetical protein